MPWTLASGKKKKFTSVTLYFCFMRLYSFLGLGSPAEHLVFVQDEAEDSGNDFVCHDSTDSSTPWFLRVQELAHDSLIAATRAQLAKNAKASNNGRKFDSLSEVKCSIQAPSFSLFLPLFHSLLLFISSDLFKSSKTELYRTIMYFFLQYK